jgi:hypothetical protein
LRAEMPGDAGGPVVTTLVRLLFFPHEAAVHWPPGIPHALFGRVIDAQPGRVTPRDRGRVSGLGCLKT